MFGLSLAKLLLIAVAVAVLWYGYKAVRRRDARAAAPPKGAAEPLAETMVKCSVCGIYNPPGVVCTHRA